MVGSQVVEQALKRGWEVLALYRNRKPAARQGLTSIQVDLSQAELFQAPALEAFPDAIVNAAGVTEATTCDAEPELAHRLNVALPEQMAMIAHHLGARFIHLSTEHVFDGTQAPYHHTAMPNPKTLYGQTKVMAEVAVLKQAAKESVVLRLPLLMGDSLSGDRSVHERLLLQLAAGMEVTGYTDVVRQPSSAANVAAAVVELLERPNLNGLFHWAGIEPLNRYDLWRRTLEHFGLPETLLKKGLCSQDHISKDLRLQSETLITRLKTQPETFEQQLEHCTVPAACADWVAQASGRPVGLPRLIKGRDF